MGGVDHGQIFINQPQRSAPQSSQRLTYTHELRKVGWIITIILNPYTPPMEDRAYRDRNNPWLWTDTSQSYLPPNFQTVQTDNNKLAPKLHTRPTLFDKEFLWTIRLFSQSALNSVEINFQWGDNKKAIFYKTFWSSYSEHEQPTTYNVK